MHVKANSLPENRFNKLRGKATCSRFHEHHSVLNFVNAMGNYTFLAVFYLKVGNFLTVLYTMWATFFPVLHESTQYS